MEQNIVETPVVFRAWAWVEKNRKQVICGFAGLAVAGLVIGYLAWSKQEKEQAAGQALSRAVYDQATGRTDAATSADILLKIATTHAGTQAGAQALLLGAGSLFNSGKYPESHAAFERFSREYSGNALMAQAIYGMGAALAAQGKFDEAARSYKDSVDRFPQSPVAAQSQYALAAIHAAQGKLEEAVMLYEKVAGASMGSSLGNEAALRADELRASLPPISAVSVPETTVISTNPVTPQP